MNFEGNNRYAGGITKTPIVLCAPEGAAYLCAEGRRLVCLVRHGQTDWNTERRLQGREPVPLNDSGRCQASECGKVLSAARDDGLGIAAVYTSPLGRAADTALGITSSLGMDAAEAVDLLIERDYGKLSGLNTEERRKLRQSTKEDLGVESVEDTAARMKRALVEISAVKEAGAVVAVTHGGIINALFSCITRGRIGTGKNFSENCGISLVAVGKDATFPLAYGLTGDLFLEYEKAFINRYNELRYTERNIEK